MTAAEASAFFDRYADAFTRLDVDAICALWAFPGFFAARGKRAAFDEAAFRANTHAICAFYQAQGMVRATKRIAAVTPVTATIIAVTTDDELFDKNGAKLVSWAHGYLVSETADGPRVIAALPDAELDAWDRRGVKLGSW